jgi:D-alanyl-D-alanine carboxypeptidase/D-alanyl-D-alanine-endopeptidase (penicillin-binding protein 4)
MALKDVPVANGSGLSRSARDHAWGLARCYRPRTCRASCCPLMASLPITGVDGTLRRAAVRRCRRGLGAPEIGHAAGITALTRLRAHAQRPAPGRGRHHQPCQCVSGAAGADLVDWAVKEGSR